MVLHQYIVIGFLNLLAAMSPGPDFAIVTRNALISHKHGTLTALGIAIGVVLHVLVCSTFLLFIQSKQLILVLHLLGGAYLIYLGVSTLKSQSIVPISDSCVMVEKKYSIAWLEGFLTNISNPKCALFFISIFTATFDHSLSWCAIIFLATELFFIIFFWFALLSFGINQSFFRQLLGQFQWLLMKALAVFLLLLGFYFWFSLLFK